MPTQDFFESMKTQLITNLKNKLLSEPYERVEALTEDVLDNSKLSTED